MKTISGRVASSNPVSLSKATSVLTTFVAAETGASQAVVAETGASQAMEAFNELTQLHRELKGSKSSRKHKRAKEGHENPRLPEPTNEHVTETESAKGCHEKKKRKSAEVEEGGVEHSEEQQSKRKRKKSD